MANLRMSAQIIPNYICTEQASFIYHYIIRKTASQTYVSLQKLVTSTNSLQLSMFKASGTLLASQMWLVSKCITSNKSLY